MQWYGQGNKPLYNLHGTTSMHAKHAIGYRSLGTYSYQNFQKTCLKLNFREIFVYAANTTLHINNPLV